MSIITIALIVTSLRSVEASGSGLLERLLEPTLKTASCHARCEGLPREELQDCLDICSLVSRDPRTSICQYPRFCTGGCRAACQNNVLEERVSLVSLSQEDCVLTWHLTSSTSSASSTSSTSSTSPLLLVVVGRDESGMWSLLSGLEKERRLEVSPATTSKYTEITVLAVDREGLADSRSVKLTATTQCPASHHVTGDKIQNSGSGHLALLTSLALLGVLIILLLAVIVVRKQKTVGPETHIPRDFLLTREDFLYEDQHSKKYTFF